MFGDGGDIVGLDNDEKDRINKDVIEEFAKKAYRTLTLGYKDVSRADFEA